MVADFSKTMKYDSHLLYHSRVVTGPGGVAFDPVTGARRRR